MDVYSSSSHSCFYRPQSYGTRSAGLGRVLRTVSSARVGCLPEDPYRSAAIRPLPMEPLCAEAERVGDGSSAITPHSDPFLEFPVS
jgi:hypothetical protein